MKMTFVKLALAAGVGMATLAACGSENDGYDPNVPTTMLYIGGSGQSAETGAPVGELLTIKTVNFVGDPVGGVSVEWFVVNGGGTVSKGETETDANGISQVSWILGPVVGNFGGGGVLAGAPAVDADPAHRLDHDQHRGDVDAHVGDVEDRPVRQLDEVDDVPAEPARRPEQPVGAAH